MLLRAASLRPAALSSYVVIFALSMIASGGGQEGSESRTASYETDHHDGRTVTMMLKRIGEGSEGGDDWEGDQKASCSSEDEACNQTQVDLCWGYEKDCTRERRLFTPHCEAPAQPWAKDLEAKRELFWHQGDFGYVKDVVDSMMTLCEPKEKGDSFLHCSDHLRYCEAKHLYIDFTRFKEMSQTEGRYRSFLEDIFRPGEVGGHCQFNSELHRQHGDHKSPLQSWFAELEQYTELDFKPTSRKHCDEIITKPTIFMKLDAGVNLYHHFCDFFNLYASQHAYGSFSDDVYIVMWDTHYMTYPELFGETWRAFTQHPLKRLSDFEGKRMCFKEVLFPLLPRMRGGLYYNTYIVPHCHSSGLMQAFSKHLLPRLGVYQEPSPPQVVRVTLLSRSTKHRRIVNENELVNAMKTVGFLDVRVVDYKARVYPFLEQIQSSHNTDIFIGMHGSGLTHMLFLPDWAAGFEIYNTEDPRCYHDVARLRGVQYITWEDGSKMLKEAEGKHPTMGTPHSKFTNYTFDVTEFMRLVLTLADAVKERKEAAWTHRVLDTS